MLCSCWKEKQCEVTKENEKSKVFGKEKDSIILFIVSAISWWIWLVANLQLQNGNLTKKLKLKPNQFILVIRHNNNITFASSNVYFQCIGYKTFSFLNNSSIA